MILALLVAMLGFNGYAQTKTGTDMKQEIKKMEELIQERLGMVKTYPEKPAYYLQVNKTGCRLLVRVNDIPIGYHFVKMKVSLCYILSMICYLEAVNIP